MMRHLLLALILDTCGIGCARQSTPPLPTPPPSAAPARDGGTMPAATAASDEPIPTGWKTHVEAGEFRLSYPPDSTLTTGAAAGAGLLGTALVRVTLPATQFGSTKSNLVEAYLVLGTSSEPSAVTGCSTFSDVQTAGEARPPKRVHGVEFVSRSSVEGAAGNLYDGRLYRVARANRCYEVALIVRTGNIGNYEPGAVEKFEDQRAFNVLERIFATLRLGP
jgi:hypothetical protein